MTDGWVDLGGKFLNKPYADFKDPIQGGFKNCMMVAAMSSITWENKKWITNQNGPPFQITLYDAGVQVPVSVSRRQFVSNNIPVGCTSVTPDEIWPAMVEKAFAKFCEYKLTHTLSYADLGAANVEPNFSNLPTGVQWGGNPVTAKTYLRPFAHTGIYSASQMGSDSCYEFIKSSFIDRPVGKTKYQLSAWTSADAPASDATIVADHSYSVLGICDSARKIILRNPYGRIDSTSPASAQQISSWTIPHDNLYNNGSYFPPQGGQLNLPMNSQGIFAIDPDTFVKCFEWFGFAY